MNIVELSIKRPVFLTCLVLLMLALGYMGLKRMPVDLFPSIEFPVVLINVPYPGAGPKEVETLISKVIEQEVSRLPGIKTVRSINREGICTVIAEFTLETDIKYAEQLVRDRVSAAKSKLPVDVLEPEIRRLDPAEEPIVTIAVSSDLKSGALYTWVDTVLKPKLEQIANVGQVEIKGGRKREIRVELDQHLLRAHDISASRVASVIASSGQNVPAGSVPVGDKQTVIRTVAEYKTLAQIGETVVGFVGNDRAVKVSDLGYVLDTLEDASSITYSNGRPAIFLNVYRQSGSNTVAVADNVKKQLAKLERQIADDPGHPKLTVVKDRSAPIRANISSVRESIMLGIILTIVVVYFFLGNFRSTLITVVALPTSILGAFMLASWVGFSINVMTLLALSLAVGLVIDDAIVVRENIFRHIEMGKSGPEAALIGTKEVTLAVIATTASVLAVFGPIAFLHGIVGQFFKEFGLMVCFAMAISLFDALTVAPMLSAYFASGSKETKGIVYYTIGYLVRGFQRFQDRLEHGYERLIRFTLRHPLFIILLALAITCASFVAVKHVPKTFLPAQDNGEFVVSLELPPGVSLDAMNHLARTVDDMVRNNKEVKTSTLSVGGRFGESNVAEIYVNLVPHKMRKMNTSDFKAFVRDQLKPFAAANPIVKDTGIVSGGERPFNLNIVGEDLIQIQGVSQTIFDWLKTHPGLKDVDLGFKPGKPEFQIQVLGNASILFGVSPTMLGFELRTMVAGTTGAVLRDTSEETAIRVRLKEDQRDLSTTFSSVVVPNINHSLVSLSNVAFPVTTEGPNTITRQNRARYVQISGDIAPNGPGIGGVIDDINATLGQKIPLPKGVSYEMVGQAENFKELGQNMMLAALLGVLFIYLVLASLYESFVTPLTIMLVLPLAICGAFFALFITQESLDIFSMIGCIMLLGVATKNSILLVDRAHQLVEQGHDFDSAIIQAGRTRLRPILMTTFALIAGMLPIAIGLDEASRQRTSMGVAIIGGLISSTLLTLVVIPATYQYVERFRRWSIRKLAWLHTSEV